MFENGHPQYNTGRTHFQKGQVSWNKGKHFSEESKQKMSNSSKGCIPWNKGKEGIYSKETIRRISATKKGQMTGENNPFFGKHHSEESKLRMSKVAKGRIPWNKNKKGSLIAWNKGSHSSEETKRKLSDAHKGQLPWNKGLTIESDERVRRGNETHKANLTKEIIKKIMTRRIPTSLEAKFQEIVDKNHLPYKYVGNGAFIIENKNPDFINTNGQKIAVEVYAEYFKLKNHKSIEEWQIERNRIFAKYGWQIVYFNEIEVNEDNILNCLREKNACEITK